MPGISLRFPKMVEIQNPRLIILYYTIQLSTCSFLLWWFISQKFWDKEVSIGSFIGATMVVSEMPIYTDQYRARLDALRQTLCPEASKYNVWVDREGFYAAENITCAVPCAAAPNVANCSEQQETYFATGDSEIFIPTTRSVALKGDLGLGSTQEFLLTADSLGISFAYFFDIPLVDMTGNARLQRLTGSSDSNLGTYLYADDGSQQGYYPPGQRIAFTVQELLQLAGNPTSLDTPNPRARNRRPGSENPTGRISGVELLVTVDCEGAVGFYRHQINSCSISVHKSERGWVYERALDLFSLGRKTAAVTYTGIRIKVQGQGKGSHWDIGTLVSRITTCLVIMTLPKRLCMVLCTYLLGHLSTIYRQAIYDKFQLREALAGMSARLLVWNTAFVDLVDNDSGDNCGISKKRILERLNALLKNKSTELDAGEINHLCEFCHSALLRLMDEAENKNHLGKQLQSQLKDVTNEIAAVSRGNTVELHKSENRVINSDIFSVACTSSENLNFDAVVKLFDVQRRRSCIERIFTPRELSTDLNLSVLKKAKAVDDSTSSESSAEVPADSMEDPMADCEGGLPEQRPSLIRRDASGSFTLEEERELRKNLHKKVADLLDAKARLFDSYDDIKRLVHDHRQHFDTRHREHYSKVVQESEVSQKRIAQMEVTVQKSQKNLEERVADLTGQNASLSTLNRVLHQRLDAIEAMLRTGIHPDRQPTQLPVMGREPAPQPAQLPVLGRESTCSSAAPSAVPSDRRSSVDSAPRQPPHLSPPLPSPTPNPNVAPPAAIAVTPAAQRESSPSVWSEAEAAARETMRSASGGLAGVNRNTEAARGTMTAGTRMSRSTNDGPADVNRQKETARFSTSAGPPRTRTSAKDSLAGVSGAGGSLGPDVLLANRSHVSAEPATDRPSSRLLSEEVPWQRGASASDPSGEGPWKSLFLATLTTADTGGSGEGEVQSL